MLKKTLLALSNQEKVLFRLGVLALLLRLPLASLGQESPAFQLKGTAVNTSDPKNPVAAPIEIVVRRGLCKLTVSLPLNGSGGCTVKSYDEETGRIEVVSFGPPTIA